MNIWCDRTLVRSPTYIGLCVTPEFFERELRRLKMPRKDWPNFLSTTHADATVHFVECDNGNSGAIVCVKKSPKRDLIELHGLLVHEAVHIWQEIRENIGETKPSSEFEAYSIQSISQQLMAEYRRQTKRQPPSRRLARKRKGRA